MCIFLLVKNAAKYLEKNTQKIKLIHSKLPIDAENEMVCDALK